MTTVAIWSDEYSIIHSEMDIEGVRNVVVTFKPNVPHESLMWNLANTLFGKGCWHIASQTMHTEWQHGPAHAEYEVHRGCKSKA
jgi:hypothetical protein